MENIELNIVGSEEKPIEIYWNYENKKSDKLLLIMSICSGAYGYNLLDQKTFCHQCNEFFKFAKKYERYIKQIEFVLSYGEEECVNYLKNIMSLKRKLVLNSSKEEKTPLA